MKPYFIHILFSLFYLVYFISLFLINFVFYGIWECTLMNFLDYMLLPGYFNVINFYLMYVHLESDTPQLSYVNKVCSGGCLVQKLIL